MAIIVAPLPGYPSTPECPKCGGQNIRQTYSTNDTITHLCGCGYWWYTLPLDRTLKEKHERPAKKKG